MQRATSSNGFERLEIEFISSRIEDLFPQSDFAPRVSGCFWPKFTEAAYQISAAAHNRS